MVEVSKHAAKRLKERLGLPKSALARHAGMVYDKGKTHADAKGRMRRYLDALYLGHRTANQIRWYGRNVYIFCDERLITVFPIPTHFKSGAPK